MRVGHRAPRYMAGRTVRRFLHSRLTPNIRTANTVATQAAMDTTGVPACLMAMPAKAQTMTST